MMKNTILVCVFVVFSVVTTGCNPTDEQKAQFFVAKTARKFDLTDQQKARLFDVVTVALERYSQMVKDEPEVKQELVAMFASDELDQAKINGVLAEKEELFRKYSRLLVARIAEFHSALTPEQRRQIIEAFTAPVRGGPR